MIDSAAPDLFSKYLFYRITGCSLLACGITNIKNTKPSQIVMSSKFTYFGWTDKRTEGGTDKCTDVTTDAQR